MSKAVISYEQVASIANDLYRNGVKDPSAKAVREELARRAGPGRPVGSPNTIQRFLVSWRQNGRPIDDPPSAPQLPRQLVVDIDRALKEIARGAREEVDQQLLQLQSELSEVAATGEEQEHQLELMSQALAESTSERDMAVGQLKDQAADATDLRQALARERDSNEALRIDLAKVRLILEASDARIGETRQQAESWFAELTRLRAELDIERSTRAVAERRVEVSEVRVDMLSQAKQQAEDGLQVMQARVRELENSAMQGAATEVLVIELRAQLDVLRRLIPRSRSQPTAKVGQGVEQAGTGVAT